MLQVTIDIFSGVENPTQVIEDEGQAREFLKEIANLGNTFAVAENAASANLGFRGLVIEPVSDEVARDFGITSPIRIPASLAVESRAQDLVQQLISTITPAATTTTVEEGRENEAIEEESVEEFRQFLLDQVTTSSRQTVQESDETATTEALPAATCFYEVSPYNPAFWNNDATTLRNNNCYNYASNKRTNTFAQPGRGCGQMYRALNCAELTRASLCDRLRRRFDCVPDAEKPRYLVALVIWPNRDFHWYRLNSGGLWSHKPGGTPARNVDNSGRVIRDPATCDRGPYTNFCGYFYTCRSQLIR